MKVAKQSGVNKATADYLWKTKKIHLCTQGNELFLACPNKSSEKWAKVNYPHFGVWDFEKGVIVYYEK